MAHYRVINWITCRPGILSFTAALAAAPLLAWAQPITTCSSFITFLERISNFGGAIVLTVAVIVFLIGAFYFLFSGGSEEAVKKGRSFIIYGAVGILVAIVAFSIPNLVRNISGISLPPCPN